MSNILQYRNWRNDYKAAEEFCEKYGLCCGDVVYNNNKYSVLFLNTDGDEIECCISKNTGDLSNEPSVKYSDIILQIPLNERDLSTDLYQKLLEYCLANNIIT